MRRFGERGVGRRGVTEIVIPIENKIAGNVVEELRGASCNRRPGVGDGRQRLIIDVDRFGGVARDDQSLGHDEGDRLADMAHFAEREQRTRRVVARRAIAIGERYETGNVAETLSLDVFAGAHEQHARQTPRRRCIDAGDARMGHRRAQHEGMRHARQRDVVGIAAMPGDQPQILVPTHGLADGEFHALSFHSRFMECEIPKWNSSAGQIDE